MTPNGKGVNIFMKQLRILLRNHVVRNIQISCVSPQVTLVLTIITLPKISKECSHDKIMVIIYLNLIICGVLGNSILLYLYILNFFTAPRTRLKSLIIIHLAFVNIIIILLGGIPRTMQIWGLESFLDISGGKTITYFQRVFRHLSMWGCCFLTIFQAITISPNSPRWAELKGRTLKSMTFCCIFCWIFNLLLEINVTVYLANPKNSSKERWNIGFNFLDIYDMNTIRIAIWISIYEGVLMGVMAISSGYMMLVLNRHHQRVQYIHGTSNTHRSFPEIRATKNILLLVSTFICFNAFCFPFIIYIVPSRETRNWVIQVIVLFSFCYPAVSPIMLIINDNQIHRSCCDL